jgi:hypothetical protein
MSHLKNLTGQIFGNWTVVRYSHKIGNRYYWLCRCSCGKLKTSCSADFKTGKSLSCGCLAVELRRQKAMKPKGESGFNTLYRKYKDGAAKRNLEFFLTKEEFKNLTKGLCFYCGTLPSRVGLFGYSRRATSQRVRDNATYVYNGIDRILNNIGYTSTNCVSCCFDCNRMKGTMSYEKFILQCQKITQLRG